MPSPIPKKADKRVDKRPSRSGLAVIEGGFQLPPAPRGLCPEALRAWNEYWADTVAGVIRRSDEPLVERWVRNLDRYHRLLRAADTEGPTVHGSTGQPRVNPVYDLAYKVEASIKADEQQLGIGPLNRMRLGLVLNEGRKSLAELNSEAESANDDPRALFDHSSVAGGGSKA